MKVMKVGELFTASDINQMYLSREIDEHYVFAFEDAAREK